MTLKAPLGLPLLQDTFVTGFGKTCIVHTSDFAHSQVHKIRQEKHIYRSEICMTHGGIVALQSLQVSCLSDIHNRFL